MPHRPAVERTSPFVSPIMFSVLAEVQAPALCSNVCKISVLMLFQAFPSCLQATILDTQ
jgi:hypothetical protein